MNLTNVALPGLSSSLCPLLLALPTTPLVRRWSPSSMLDGWACDGTTVTVPLTSLTGLTADAADGISGDARQVCTALVGSMFAWFNEQNTAGTAPTALTIKYNPGSIRTTDPYIGAQKAEFTMTAYLDFPATTVVSEV